MMTLQNLLGIELPIVQAPMAGVQGSALAVAVSNAGGLGSLPCAMLGLDAMRNELAAIKAQTGRPFNVNFFCHVPPTPNAGREAAWRAALSPYYQEFGIDADTIPAGPGRSPFTSDAADVLGEFKPAVVSFHFGLPPADLLARVRAWGRRYYLRQPPSTRRVGSKRMGSTRSSRKAWRPVVIAGCSCRKIWILKWARLLCCRKSCGE